MNIKKGYKLVISKEKGKYHLEISRHRISYMDNILIINSIGSKKYVDTWIIDKDLENWVNGLKKEGFTIIKSVEDVESSKKNNRNKK
jgi:hypothetical protein